MSTIVAVEKNGHAAVACDTMFSIGSIRSVNADQTKALRVGESVIAVAGFSVYLNILEHYFADSDTVPALQDEIAVFDFFLHFWRVLHDRYTYINDQSNSEHPSPFADLDADRPAPALVAGVDLVIVRWPDQDEVSVLYGRCLHRGPDRYIILTNFNAKSSTSCDFI